MQIKVTNHAIVKYAERCLKTPFAESLDEKTRFYYLDRIGLVEKIKKAILTDYLLKLIKTFNCSGLFAERYHKFCARVVKLKNSFVIVTVF